MDEIIKRYKGRTTSQGHKLEVSQESDGVAIGFKHLGEYGDEYDPYVRVAIIKEFDRGFTLSLFYRDAEEPTTAGDFARERDLFAALDKAVEERSKEVGPI
jgi:hypothetical protein